MLTQRQIDRRSGHAATFWKNVLKQPDGKWMWLGHTNTNHNTVDCRKYEYGEYELVTRETSNLSRPQKAHASKLAHRIILFLVYGRELSRQYEVFPLFGDYLDINPDHLGVRDVKTRREMPAPEFFEIANDNRSELAVAA